MSDAILYIEYDTCLKVVGKSTDGCRCESNFTQPYV